MHLCGLKLSPGLKCHLSSSSLGSRLFASTIPVDISCRAVFPVAASGCQPYFLIPTVKMVLGSENLILKVAIACSHATM